MVRLVPADYERLLDILARTSHGTADTPIPPDVVESIRQLIGADSMGYFEGAPWDRARRRVSLAGHVPLWSTEDRENIDRYRFQLPTLPSPHTLGRAVRITDFIPVTAYRRLDLYQAVGRRHGIEYSMEYWWRTADGVMRGLVFDRSTADFSDRNRDALDVLGLHLATAFARFAPDLPDARRVNLSDRQAEILAWVARGLTNAEVASVLGISAHTVRKHLENSFERLGVHSRTGAIAAISAAEEGPRAWSPAASADRRARW